MSTTTPSTGSSGRTVLTSIFLGIALMLTIGNCRHKYTVAKQAAEEFARTNRPPAVSVARQVVERPLVFRTLEIPPNGLSVKLYKSFKTWPKGGPVSITTPWGEIITDQPGVDTKFDQQDGIYIFLADPKGSERKVEILNKWDD